MPDPALKRQLKSTVNATPLMTPTKALGLSVRLLMFELRETGDWDIFLGSPERARAETGGADQWVLKQIELPGFAMANGKKRPHPWDTYPPSVFNKNSLLLKQTKEFYNENMLGMRTKSTNETNKQFLKR